ncbi:MAG: hypothetical protein WAU95_11920, partial [Anaerolineae bacterium]
MIIVSEVNREQGAGANRAGGVWRRLARRLSAWQAQMERWARFVRWQWQPEARAWLHEQTTRLASASPQQRWQAAAALRGAPL